LFEDFLKLHRQLREPKKRKAGWLGVEGLAAWGAGAWPECRRWVRREHAKGRAVRQVLGLGCSGLAWEYPVVALVCDFWPVAGLGLAGQRAAGWGLPLDFGACGAITDGSDFSGFA